MSPLQRYVSSELTHFVGRCLSTDDDRYVLLARILVSGWLTHPPHDPSIAGNLTVNPQARVSENEMYSPEVVCFCDIPVDDLEIHIRKYSSFGLSFSKSFLVSKGANPVFYVAKNSAVGIPADMSDAKRREEAFERSRSIGAQAFLESVPRAQHFDRAISEYHSLVKWLRNLILEQAGAPGVPEEFRLLFRLEMFLDFQIFSFLKFFDDAKPEEDPENFYMEREWRILGNVAFNLGDVRRVILPESYASRLHSDVPQYVGQVTYAG